MIDIQSLLSARVTEMEESATIKMTQKARDLKNQGYDVISLSIGEPDFDTPELVKTSAKKALDAGYTKYTPVPGIPQLRDAIVKKFQEDNGLDFSPNQIIVSNGAKQCIANTCLALLDPGDEIIIFAPYWVSYVALAKFCGAKPVVINTDIDEDFIVQPEQLREAITDKTKAILFSTPCNPSGSVFGKEDLDKLVEVIEEHENIVVISDEIYEYINFGKKHISIGSYESLKSRTVTVNGFSKGFSMTGWRLGYMGAPQWLASAVSKIQGQLTSGASSFGQHAAITALEERDKAYGDMVGAFRKRKELVRELLSEIPGIRVNDPKGAFYLFPNVSELYGKSKGDMVINNSLDFAEYILTEAHVAVVAGEAFGNDNCFRLSYAASEEQLKEALRRMKEAISSLT